MTSAIERAASVIVPATDVDWFGDGTALARDALEAVLHATPSDEWVEDMARAMADAEDECDWDQRPESSSDTFADFTPKETFRGYARAAYTALRARVVGEME